jgi:thioredoxin 1
MKSKTIVETSSSQFGKDVLESGVPVFVDFHAEWCGPCRMIEPIVDDLSQQYQGKVKFVSVDTDQNPELTEKYSIMSIPTIMLVKEGKIVEQVIGAAPPTVYKKKIDSLLIKQTDNGRGESD